MRMKHTCEGVCISNSSINLDSNTTIRDKNNFNVTVETTEGDALVLIILIGLVIAQYMTPNNFFLSRYSRD